MANSRLRIDHHFEIAHFEDEILVECPQCGHCARGAGRQYDRAKLQTTTKMSCLHCSHQHTFIWKSFDHSIALPLWLRTRCCGEVLWALNSRHLMALEAYVSAGLRENKLGTPSTRHVLMSLPRWITSKKNRPDVLRGLKRLRQKLSQLT